MCRNPRVRANARVCKSHKTFSDKNGGTIACYYFKSTDFFLFATKKISAGQRPQAARLLRSWVRIPPGAWIFVCC